MAMPPAKAIENVITNYQKYRLPEWEGFINRVRSTIAWMTGGRIIEDVASIRQTISGKILKKVKEAQTAGDWIKIIYRLEEQTKLIADEKSKLLSILYGIKNTIIQSLLSTEDTAKDYINEIYKIRRAFDAVENDIDRLRWTHRKADHKIEALDPKLFATRDELLNLLIALNDPEAIYLATIRKRIRKNELNNLNNPNIPSWYQYALDLSNIPLVNSEDGTITDINLIWFDAVRIPPERSQPFAKPDICSESPSPAQPSMSANPSEPPQLNTPTPSADLLQINPNLCTVMKTVHGSEEVLDFSLALSMFEAYVKSAGWYQFTTFTHTHPVSRMAFKQDLKLNIETENFSKWIALFNELLKQAKEGMLTKDANFFASSISKLSSYFFSAPIKKRISKYTCTIHAIRTFLISEFNKANVLITFIGSTTSICVSGKECLRRYIAMRKQHLLMEKNKLADNCERLVALEDKDFDNYFSILRELVALGDKESIHRAMDTDLDDIAMLPIHDIYGMNPNIQDETMPPELLPNYSDIYLGKPAKPVKTTTDANTSVNSTASTTSRPPSRASTEAGKGEAEAEPDPLGSPRMGSEVDISEGMRPASPSGSQHSGFVPTMFATAHEPASPSPLTAEEMAARAAQKSTERASSPPH